MKANLGVIIGVVVLLISVGFVVLMAISEWSGQGEKAVEKAQSAKAGAAAPKSKAKSKAKSRPKAPAKKK